MWLPMGTRVLPVASMHHVPLQPLLPLAVSCLLGRRLPGNRLPVVLSLHLPNFQEMCFEYICKYIDCISQICKKICSENMQKYAVLYAKYAEVYSWHILHSYALSTLLMSLVLRLLLPHQLPHDLSMGPIPLGVSVCASLQVSALASALTSCLPPSPVFNNTKAAILATCSYCLDLASEWQTCYIFLLLSVCTLSFYHDSNLESVWKSQSSGWRQCMAWALEKLLCLAQIWHQ